MGAAGHSPLSEALNRLWTQFLPTMEERVRVLETAAAALRDGSLTAAQCEQAAEAAHKLAGVLGTFGLSEGTEIAREAEAFYSGGPHSNAETGNQSATMAVRLRAMLTERK